MINDSPPPPAMREQLTAFLDELEAARKRLDAERAARAARPPKLRRRPSAARMRRRRGPVDAEHQSHEDRAFEQAAAMKARLIETMAETAVKIALAAAR